MKTTKNTTQFGYSLEPTSLVSKHSAEVAINSRRQLARLSFVVALILVTLVSAVIPAAAAPVTLSSLAGSWQATLLIDGGCGLGTKLVDFTLNSNGAGTASASYHTPGCGNNEETGTMRITSLGITGDGTALLTFGGTDFNFSIQAFANGQVFNMVDITDPGNYEEGMAVRQASPTLASLAGSWQATLVIDGGCGVGTKLVDFTLNSNGAGTASASYHTPGCGNNEETGTMRITSLNAGGNGTAELNFGGSAEFKFNIQVLANGKLFNMVDVTDSNNYEEGSAVRRGSITLSQLAGVWQAALFIDGGCGVGTKLVTFNLLSNGEGDAYGTYHTPECGNNAETGSIEITSLNPTGTGTAQVIFGSTQFNFNIQASANGQVFNLVDITDSGNYEEGSAIKQ